jgi:hypothetical protein
MLFVSRSASFYADNRVPLSARCARAAWGGGRLARPSLKLGRVCDDIVPYGTISHTIWIVAV